MDAATGEFSGTGDGGAFVLAGTELGATVQFTQSQGGYVATDSASLELNDGKLEMNEGIWSDTNGSGGTFTASIAYSGTISGTVMRDGKPLPGVTLAASDSAGDKASATVPPRHLPDQPVKDRDLDGHAERPRTEVSADGSHRLCDWGLDRRGLHCWGSATLEMDKHIAKSSGIELWYRGRDWDPTGSAIALRVGGQTVGSEPAASAIAGNVTIPYWPSRHTVSNDKDPPQRRVGRISSQPRAVRSLPRSSTPRRSGWSSGASTRTLVPGRCTAPASQTARSSLAATSSR